MIYARKIFRFKVNETNSHYFLYIQNKYVLSSRLSATHGEISRDPRGFLDSARNDNEGTLEVTKRIAPVKLMLSGGEEYC